MEHLLVHVAHAEQRVNPEYLLLAFPEQYLQGLPVLVSISKLDGPVVASVLADLLGQVDGHDHGWFQLHILDVVELFLLLGVAFQDKPLHLAVLFGNPLLYEFLHQEVVDEFVVDIGTLDLATMDGVPSNFLGDEDAGRNIDQIVMLSDSFAQGGPTTARGS